MKRLIVIAVACAALFFLLPVMVAFPQSSTGNYARIWLDRVAGAAGCRIDTGSGTPEGAVSGRICDLFLRTNGSTNTAGYLKTSGTDTNTGWSPVLTGPLVEKRTLDLALCQNATAVLLWSTPTTNPGVAACATGTNTQYGTVDFADGANSLSIQKSWKLPSDWSGAIDVDLRWHTTATTGDVVWQVATICVADAETADPVFNTASTVTDTAKGTTLQTNLATITGVTITGCAANELMFLKVFRDPATGADTLAATARLLSIEITYRRTL